MAVVKAARVAIARARLAARRPPRAYWALRYGAMRPTATLRRRGRERAGAMSLPLLGPVRPEPVAVFYAIDGSGLGHLARSLAIASRLRGVTPYVVTTSTRAEVLDAYGIVWRRVPSLRDLTAADPATSRGTWQAKLTATMLDVFERRRPAVLVADCVAADAGLVRAWRRAPHVGRIVVRRAYRLDGREHLVAGLDAECDALLIPHARDEHPIPVPAGPAAHWVGPLALCGPEEAMSRADARAALGLPAEGLVALVQMGTGDIGGGRAAERAALEALANAGATAVVTSYDPPGAAALPGRVRAVHRFPLAEVLAAFDLAVAAPGYNTFTELMMHGVPSVLVPNTATISDDQSARATRAATAGAALVVQESDAPGLAGAVARLCDDAALRASTSEAARRLAPSNGADAAARAVEELCEAILARATGAGGARGGAGAP